MKALAISFAISTAYALIAALMAWTYDALNTGVLFCGGAVFLVTFVLSLVLLCSCGVAGRDQRVR